MSGWWGLQAWAGACDAWRAKACTHTRTHRHMYIQIHTCRRTHRHMHIQIHAHTHRHMHIQIHAHTHRHMHTTNLRTLTGPRNHLSSLQSLVGARSQEGHGCPGSRQKAEAGGSPLESQSLAFQQVLPSQPQNPRPQDGLGLSEQKAPSSAPADPQASHQALL